MKRVRECVYGGELDIATLVWTRGRDFPIGMLESRLRCPGAGRGGCGWRSTFLPTPPERAAQTRPAGDDKAHVRLSPTADNAY